MGALEPIMAELTEVGDASSSSTVAVSSGVIIIFVLLKLTSLVTLFESKLQPSKNSPNGPIFDFFSQLLSTFKL